VGYFLPPCRAGGVIPPKTAKNQNSFARLKRYLHVKAAVAVFGVGGGTEEGDGDAVFKEDLRAFERVELLFAAIGPGDFRRGDQRMRASSSPACSARRLTSRANSQVEACTRRAQVCFMRQ